MRTLLKLREFTPEGVFAHPVEIETEDKRIFFHGLPFCFKDEIKAMKGSRWHGHVPGDNRKCWSIIDCPRNRLQLDYLQGKNIYEWFDRPTTERRFRDYALRGQPASPMPHQLRLAQSLLDYHYQIWAAEMGVGKTLSAQIAIEHSGTEFPWWWVGPKTTIPNIKRELELWGYRGEPIQFLTYDGLVQRMALRKSGDVIPQGVVFDEASKLKTASARRSIAAQELADLIRLEFGGNGYVLLMSGTPSPKSPLDWWSLAEITWPGFLREGSVAALERRLAYLEMKKHAEGAFMSRIGWRDDTAKCATCGQGRFEHHAGHVYAESKNEVAFLHDRLKGLVVVQHAKDCLDLPPVRYVRVPCPPSPSLLRAARAIAASAETAAQAALLLRELSDGFQYREVQDGTVHCHACSDGRVLRGAVDGVDSYGDCSLCGGSAEVPRLVRVAREVACPKDAALLDIVEQCEEIGRVVIFAGFLASVDRCVRLLQRKGWSVVRVDSRGFNVFDHNNNQLDGPDLKPLDYWADTENNLKVAYVAQPDSGGMSFTLTEARAEVFYSNSFRPDSRVQAVARINRMGSRGCTVYDLIHLPSDERTIEVVTENRRLELMTLGDFTRGMFDGQEAIAA